VLITLASLEAGMGIGRILGLLLAGAVLLVTACTSRVADSTGDGYRAALTALRADVRDPTFWQLEGLDYLTGDLGLSPEYLSLMASTEIDRVLEVEQWVRQAEGRVDSRRVHGRHPDLEGLAEFGEHARLSLWLLSRGRYAAQLVRESDGLDDVPIRPDGSNCYWNVAYFLWGLMAASDEGMRQLEAIYHGRGYGIDGEVALTLYETINKVGVGPQAN
jgi:hypothetical protein